MFPKERLEVFCGGSIAAIDNYRTLKFQGWSGEKSQRLWKQDKGQKNCSKSFVSTVEGSSGFELIEFSELYEVASACFDVMDQIEAS
jgi:hypothetical protein